MNIKINKSDVNDHLWFQRLREARLHVETLRRAIEAGHVPSDTKELRGFEVTVDDWCPTTADASYYVETDESLPHHIQHFVAYTLSEVLGLAMTEPK